MVAVRKEKKIMIRKFRCEVTRVDEYEIELDDEVLNEEFLNEFSKYFYEFDTLEEHAEYIAEFRARFGERFIEGYGSPLVNGKKPYFEQEKYVNKAINIKVISEDDDCEVEVEELDG